MQILGLSSFPFSDSLASMMSSGDTGTVLFNPKEYVAWTNLKFIGSGNRVDRGMLALDGSAVALVNSRQLSYKDALSYENCHHGCHVIIFKGCDQTRDGVVFITVSSVDNLALITESENLPDQVVIASSFSFNDGKIPALEKELKRCGYSLLGDDNTFRRGGHKWSHAVVDIEASVIIGYITASGKSPGNEDEDDTVLSISDMMSRMSKRTPRPSSVDLNISTTDVVLIKALIDFHEKVNELETVDEDD